MLLAANELTDKKWSRAALWLILGFLIKPRHGRQCDSPRRRHLWEMFRPPRRRARRRHALPIPPPKNPTTSPINTPSSSEPHSPPPPPDREFCNLHGLFAHFNINIPSAPFQWITLAAAGITLALWLLAHRREEPARSFFLFALQPPATSSSSTPEPNPTPTSSVAPAVALAAVLALFRFQNVIVGWLLIGDRFLPPSAMPGAITSAENWLKPLVSLLFFAMLAARILRKSQPQLEPRENRVDG